MAVEVECRSYACGRNAHSAAVALVVGPEADVVVPAGGNQRGRGQPFRGEEFLGRACCGGRAGGGGEEVAGHVPYSEETVVAG